VTTLNTNQRLREFFYYPKLSNEEDRVLDQRKFAAYLAEPAPAESVDSFIYIHIPFCDYLCHFCPFYKTLNQTTSEETRAAFVRSLIHEIELYSAAPLMAGRRIHWVEFGGGTPTSLSTDQLSAVLRALRSNFDMDGCEFITMEGDALTLQEEDKLVALAELGLNRVSFGVQTFKEPLRRKLGLKPTIDDLYAAAASIRRAGIGEFAVDLLYNLPDQSVEELGTDVRTIFSLDSDYIDTYPLTLWDNSRFKHQVEAGKMYTKRPNDEDNIRMYRLIQQEMEAHGYAAVHSYTFARGHRRYIVNVKNHILRDGDMIGLGPSSRGHIRDRQYTNVASIDAYIGSLARDELPVSLGMFVSPQERAHRLMVMFPSLLLAVDESAVPHFDRFADTVDALRRDGYLNRRGGQIEMTREGLVWAGNISRLFFSQEQRAKMTRAHLYALRHKVNPYNQDTVGVPVGTMVRTRVKRG
jgi:oxygen-independent coproporphyrinogen-3 oxidase